MTYAEYKKTALDQSLELRKEYEALADIAAQIEQNVTQGKPSHTKQSTSENSVENHSIFKGGIH